MWELNADPAWWWFSHQGKTAGLELDEEETERLRAEFDLGQGPIEARPGVEVRYEDGKARLPPLLMPDSDLLEMNESRPGQVESFYGRSSFQTIDDVRREAWNRHCSLEAKLIGPLTESDAFYKSLYDQQPPDTVTFEPLPYSGVWGEASAGHRGYKIRSLPPVQVHPVLEPLKVRLITKGDSTIYWFSRFYQKHLWDYLQGFPQFALTGRPVQDEDFHDLVSREKALGLSFTSWVSGDYSAATDNLKIQYTKAAFEVALSRSHLDWKDEVLLRDLLYEQRLYYKWREGKSVETAIVEQKTGQLMGSTLSFPILCTVNFCCYWAAMEEYLGREVSARDLPVLVNGDDILFRTDERLYPIWLRWIDEAGFELSVGKNYVNDRFFTVNSEMHMWLGDRPVHIPYMNPGLLTGSSRLNARESLQIAPIWDYYNKVVPSARDPVRAHKRFLHYHRENVSKFTNNGEYSLFLDPKFGGLGFELCEPLRPVVKFTNFQRKFGTYLRGMVLSPYEGELCNIQPFRGLVVRRGPKTQQRSRYHFSHYLAHRPFWPLNRNERKALDTSTALKGAVMAHGVCDPDEPVVSVRPPDRKVLKGFRSTSQVACPLRALLRDDVVYVEQLPDEVTQSSSEPTPPESPPPTPTPDED